MRIPLRASSASSTQRAKIGRSFRRLLSSSPQYPLDPTWAEPHPEFEDALFLAVNADRAANGVAPVKRDPLLNEIARWKAMQCAWGLYMAHDDAAPPVARPFGARFQDYGYQGGAGENLAYGFLTADSVEQAFMSDIGHRNNVLNPGYQGIGLGVAKTTANTAPGIAHPADPSLIFWCQDFGTGPVTSSPVPSEPQPGSKWRSKLNQFAKPVTVTSTTETGVSYQTSKGVVGHLTLVAFLRRYRPV